MIERFFHGVAIDRKPDGRLVLNFLGPHDPETGREPVVIVAMTTADFGAERALREAIGERP